MPERIISCTEFRKLLEIERDLTPEEGEEFEAHLMTCKRHHKELADARDYIVPRLCDLGRALRDAFDRGVVEGAKWEELPEVLQMAIDHGEYGIIDNIITRCLKRLNDIRAIRLLVTIRHNLPDCRERIGKHLSFRTAVVGPRMVRALKDAMDDGPKDIVRSRLPSICLLAYIDPKTGDVVFEAAPAIVFRGPGPHLRIET